MEKTTKQRLTTWVGFGLVAVLALGSTAGAVIQDQRSDALARCTDQANTKLIDAINDRTRYTDEVASRTQTLWQAQLDFLRALQTADQAEGQRAFTEYLDSLDEYNRAQAKASQSRKNSPYPTVDEIQKCRAGVGRLPLSAK